MKKIIYILTAAMALLSAYQVQAQSWTELGGADALRANNPINTICKDPSGNIYAAGEFTNAAGHYYVAKYDGTSWSELGGANALAANGNITGICSDPSGNIYAIGSFTYDTCTSMFGCLTYVAVYNGTSWGVLGLPWQLDTFPKTAICSDARGNIYYADYYQYFDFNSNANARNAYVNKWDPRTSTFTDYYIDSGLINTMCSYSYDTLAGGSVIYAAGTIVNGADMEVGVYARDTATTGTWPELPTDMFIGPEGPINSFCTDPSGTLYAAGGFLGFTGRPFVDVANQFGWNELVYSDTLQTNYGYAGSIFALCSDPDSNIYAGGWFTNSSGYHYVAKWNAGTWTELGGLNALSADSTILALSSDVQGNIYAAGLFTNASGHQYVARYGYPTGINEISAANIKLSPNPSNNFVTISSGQTLSNATIRLLDLTGQVLIEKTNQSGEKFTLDISNQAAGLYFIEVIQDDNGWTGKLVKE